ncbi:alpha/beta fold hydrolase [Actinomycetospora corticicola]|uniref:alpha/beta fold hydrolase n=1 Tax=Actinomycetospora corticicola TaxID=663602 RepID=UPI001C53508B|nr:alpha/beta fold hydrolase [Actinomycetospora corticicola]
MNHVRRGTGAPLVLVHGLGGSWRSWGSVLDDLAAHREVVAPDLPGFGDSAPLAGEVSIATLTDALEGFLDEHDLRGADLVGSSMGARMVLELARRGVGGDVVALDPGGFWTPGEQRVFSASLRASIALVRRIDPVLPTLLGNPVTRTALLAQFSARPWALHPAVPLEELRRMITSPSFDDALDALTHGPTQEGTPRGTAPGRITLGWGRYDGVTLPRQAARAQAAFPDAELHWFDRCGHFPQWDAPQEAVQLVLARTGARTG